MGFVANFIRIPELQKFWQSVKILQSYREFKGGNFIMSTLQNVTKNYINSAANELLEWTASNSLNLDWYCHVSDRNVVQGALHGLQVTTYTVSAAVAELPVCTVLCVGHYEFLDFLRDKSWFKVWRKYHYGTSQYCVVNVDEHHVSITDMVTCVMVVEGVMSGLCSVLFLFFFFLLTARSRARWLVAVKSVSDVVTSTELHKFTQTFYWSLH